MARKYKKKVSPEVVYTLHWRWGTTLDNKFYEFDYKYFVDSAYFNHFDKRNRLGYTPKFFTYIEGEFDLYILYKNDKLLDYSIEKIELDEKGIVHLKFWKIIDEWMLLRKITQELDIEKFKDILNNI